MKPSTVLPERNLDVLRACAVLSVLVWHVLETVFDMHREGRLGRIGVLAFFVHTSLVLMASIERGGTGSGWVKTFYFRRAARIYPLVWVTIALCVLWRLPYSTIAHREAAHVSLAVASWRSIGANALLIQNLVGVESVLAPMWSLPLEMQMYVMLPLCYSLAKRSVGGVWTAIGGAAVLGAIVAWAPLPGVWRLSVFTFGPCFLAGALAFAMLQRPVFRTHSCRWFGLLALLWTVGLFAPVSTKAVGWAFCLVLGLSIPLIPELPRSLVTRGSAQIAKYSYGIYLLHMPAWSIAFDRVHAPTFVQWAIYLVLLVLLPVVAYHGIEAPAIRWARRPRLIKPRTLAQAA